MHYDTEQPPGEHDDTSSNTTNSTTTTTSTASNRRAGATTVVVEGSSVIDGEQHQGHLHHHAHYIRGDPIKNWLTIVLMIVLSVHSIIAGLAMGVQSSLSSVIDIFIAIIAHKWVEAFALGISMMRDGIRPLRMLLLAAVYSCMTPLGALIGTLLSLALSGDAATIFTAVTTGIAAGTFVYVAVVDILVTEFMDSRDKYLKFFMTILGFVLMSGLFVLFDHEHGHDH